MSLWTDRELKKLIARVNALEERVAQLERFEGGTKAPALEPADKRTKEWREWKHANS